MKPHLLYLAFWFPPSRASGVYRALATTRAFLRAGWRVTVFTTTREFLEDEVGSIDLSLEETIPPEVEVVRVPLKFDLKNSIDVRALGWFRGNFPHIWQKLRRELYPLRYALSVLKGRLPDAFQLQEKYVAWIDPVVRTGSRFGSQHRFDHILATGNPYSAFEAARVLSGILGVPYSIDYRDPWTIDVFTGKPDHADPLTTRAEQKIVEQAAACFHVNEAIANAYKAKYPHTATKHHVVYNGFDLDSVPSRPHVASDGPLTFGILGTVNDRWPLEDIFRAWTEVRDRLPPGSQLVLGGHLGYFARSKDLLESFLPEESLGFRYLGPVPKSKVAHFYATLDVVVVPVPGGEMVTSGKIFEAVALGIPMVCVQESDGGARRLIADHPLGFGADPNVSDIETALLMAADSARSLEPSTSVALRQRALEFERETTIAALVDVILANDWEGQPA